MVIKAGQERETDLDLNSRPTTYELCDPGQATLPL